jgi:hypothetical protein
MAGKSRQIRDALVTLVSGLTYEGEPAFVSVKDSTNGEFDGFPSLRVLPDPQGGLENENVAMSQQDRTVALALLGHIESKDDNPEVDVESKAISQMLDLTDLIIDAIDEEDFTNALDIETDTGTYVMTAQLGEWNWADSSAGVLLLFLVHVKVAYSKNL